MKSVARGHLAGMLTWPTQGPTHLGEPMTVFELLRFSWKGKELSLTSFHGQEWDSRTYLEVQWLKLCVSNKGGTGSTLGSHMPLGMAKKKKKRMRLRHVDGKAKAIVVIIVRASFQNPLCAQHHATHLMCFIFTFLSIMIKSQDSAAWQHGCVSQLCHLLALWA